MPYRGQPGHAEITRIRVLAILYWRETDSRDYAGIGQSIKRPLGAVKIFRGLNNTVDVRLNLGFRSPPHSRIMPSIHRTARTRHSFIYQLEERRVLNTYREEFRGEPDHKERRTIFKSKVLVDIFNYWHSQKKAPADGAETEAAIKVCLSWFPSLHA